MDLGISHEILYEKLHDDHRVCFSEDKSMICFWKPGEEIEIYRRNAGYLINTLGTKEENSGLIDIRWFQKILFCCYSNGTVTLFSEGRELLRQYSLLPKGGKTECILCDQLHLPQDSYSLCNGELLQSIPKLNKWDVVKNELGKELLSSEEEGKQEMMNVFLTMDNKANKLIISIEGFLNVRVGEKGKIPKCVNRILRLGYAKYMLLNDLLEYQIIDLSAWTEYINTKLIKATEEYGVLLRHLKQLHRHLGMKLVDPYFQLATKLFTKQNQEALSDLFYFGSSDEDKKIELRDCLLNKVRLDSLKNLSNDLCGTSVVLMVSSMSPLLERLAILSARIESICESLTWIKFREQKFIGNVRPAAIELLKDLNEHITTIAMIEKSHRAGFIWLQSMQKRLDINLDHHEHKTNENNNVTDSTGFCTDRTDTILTHSELNQLENFLTTYTIPQTYHTWVKKTYPNKILQLQTAFDNIMKDYILKWLKKQVHTIYNNTNKMESFTINKILDIKPIPTENKLLLLLLTPHDLILLDLQQNKIEATSSLPKPTNVSIKSNFSPTQILPIENFLTISNSAITTTKPPQTHFINPTFCILPWCEAFYIHSTFPSCPSSASSSSRAPDNFPLYEIRFCT